MSSSRRLNSLARESSYYRQVAPRERDLGMEKCSKEVDPMANVVREMMREKSEKVLWF